MRVGAPIADGQDQATAELPDGHDPRARRGNCPAIGIRRQVGREGEQGRASPLHGLRAYRIAELVHRLRDHWLLSLD